MAKRISKYDLTDDLKNYLVSLWKETVEYTNEFQYTEEDLADARTLYVRNPNDLQIGIDEGLEAAAKMQKYKIKEQTSLRKNTLNYNKKYYNNDKLLKIECYCGGELDVIFIASYRDDARYLFPFTEGKSHYPTYTHVLKDHDNIIEEYMCSGAQIVYSRYETADKEKYKYISINYAPNGTYRILGYEEGIFEVTDKITYEMEKEYTWYMEFNATRKGIDFADPDIDDIIRAED